MARALAERNVVFSLESVDISLWSVMEIIHKVTSEKAVKHIFMSNNYSNDTDTAPVATGSQRLSLHIEKKIKF